MKSRVTITFTFWTDQQHEIAKFMQQNKSKKVSWMALFRKVLPKVAYMSCLDVSMEEDQMAIDLRISDIKK